MDQTSLPLDFSLYRFWINDVPDPLDNMSWSDATHLNIVATTPAEDGDVFKVQCPYGDPRLKDTDGNPCAGFPVLSDTFLVAKGMFWDEDGKLIE
jgi:hypothetical protein